MLRVEGQLTHQAHEVEKWYPCAKLRSHRRPRWEERLTHRAHEGEEWVFASPRLGQGMTLSQELLPRPAGAGRSRQRSLRSLNQLKHLVVANPGPHRSRSLPSSAQV